MIVTTCAAISQLVSGVSVRWLCDPRQDCQRIYFGNHSSHLDFVAIWLALPPCARRFARPVAGSDYWKQSPIRRYLAEQMFHAVLIERASNSLVVARASVERLAAEMGDRHSLIVFPEGTRGLDGEVGPFKSGLYYLSRLRPDVQLVPVYLENLNRILPKGEVLPVPMLSRVVFGPPLAAIICEHKVEFLATARRALIQLRTVR